MPVYLHEIKPYTWDNFSFTIVLLCLWHLEYENLSIVHIVVNLLDFLIEIRQNCFLLNNAIFWKLTTDEQDSVSHRFRMYLFVYPSMWEFKHTTVRN